MYTTLIVLIIIAIALMIIAMILLVTRINESIEMLQDYYKKLDYDILEGISLINDMEGRLDYAISRLPKTRSKKVVSESSPVENLIKNIEPMED